MECTKPARRKRFFSHNDILCDARIVLTPVGPTTHAAPRTPFCRRADPDLEVAHTLTGKSVRHRRGFACLAILAALVSCMLAKDQVPSPCRHPLDDTVDHLREIMVRDNFVHIDGKTFRKLLVWQGADTDDLDTLVAGKMHDATPQDIEPTMAFRQIAFHRMYSTNGASFRPANYRAITQIAPKEIASDNGARVYFKRSGTREWHLPPAIYKDSSVPTALANLNALLMKDLRHGPQPNLKESSSSIINDQLLIKITKSSDNEESPTPEGVHQDGTELSSITLINRKGVQSGGESRLWSLKAPTGNYDGVGVNGHPISTPSDFRWDNSLANITLTDPLETLFFFDRKIKHEARAFDGKRPCHRSVLVQFIRKPVVDGSDKILLDL